MIDLSEVGASVDALKINLGVYLPNITPQKGYSVVVLIIHQNDQFTPDIPPQQFELSCDTSNEYTLWSVTIDLSSYSVSDTDSSFGKTGNYLYRYQVLKNNVINTLWFTDPFARASGVGELALVAVPAASAFAWTDQNFVVPALDDMVVYELNVAEFNETFDGVVDRLEYLKGLGVNVIELMPITSTKEEFDWGYGPIHFMSPKEVYGGIEGFKRLVNACHSNGIAVILDSVYEHVDPDFAYNQVYNNSGEASPMIGHFALGGQYGPETNFNQQFCQEYFLQVNKYWLDEFHVDGFRYDYVPGYYDGPEGVGYAELAYNTYQYSLGMPRFKDPLKFSRIIQCAEDLDDPRGILANTYSNATWQDELLNKVRYMASSQTVDDGFAHLLDTSFNGYPQSRLVDGITMPVAPFQYLDSHDHSYLIASIELLPPLGGPGDVQYGNRDKFYKLQPYVIALYTCMGIPMLWQGQEFAENYTLPDGGSLRISFPREMHWEYFYDSNGQSLIRVYRIMANLRTTYKCLRSRISYYYNVQSNPQTTGVIAYSRQLADTSDVAMIVLNFSDGKQTVSLPFPKAGTYKELLDEQEQLVVSADGEVHEVTVNSNYGAVFISTGR